MPSLSPNADLHIANLPEDVREEGARLKAQYHALASDAGLLTEDGAMDLGRLGDIRIVKSIDLAALRALAETANALEKLTRAPLSLSQFEVLLQKEGLADKLPELRTQLATLAAYNKGTFGFSFTPEALTIPREDIPRILLGLKKGILVRPIVIDSPSADDVKRLKLQGDMTLHEYRILALAMSGITFNDMENRIAIWKQLRELRWTDLVNADGTVDASKAHLAAVYQNLPPTETITDRTGVPPRLVLIGPDDEPSENRVLADGPDGQLTVATRTSDDRTATGALEARVRFLSPEAALLALGLPGARDGQTTTFTRNTFGWLGAIIPSGDVVRLRADVGVNLNASVPSYQNDDARVLASSS